jgi:hypothetical protein
LVAVTERLAVGSSKITTFGSKEMARAIATDCWRPPERLSTTILDRLKVGVNSVYQKVGPRRISHATIGSR